MMKYPYHYDWINMDNGTGLNKRRVTGERIRMFRKKYNLSRRAFAELCNAFAVKYGTRVTQNDIAGYENYKCQPKIDKLTAISVATGMPRTWYCGFGSDNQSSSSKYFTTKPTGKAKTKKNAA